MAVTPTSVTFQVPWETPTEGADPTATLLLEVMTGATSSPFLSDNAVQRSRVLPAYGSFLKNEQSPSGYGDADVLAIHGDWSALVTAASPAERGGVVHIYGWGFGRVANPPPTGMPAYTNPLPNVVEPVTCGTWGAYVWTA